MQKEQIIKDAADRLWTAEESKEVCLAVRDLIGETDIELAYQVQQLNAERRKAQGARILGRKIGLTAPVVQKQLGVDQPDFGILWDNKQVQNKGSVSVRELMQPKAEAELAFVLSKDLSSDNLSESDIVDAIDYVLPSIEIVGSRIENWNIKITDTIADNASASHWVIGDQPIQLSDVDLINCKMVMRNKGDIVSEGIGKNCLGSPVIAALWLANQLVKMNTPMKAGDIILTGALGPMVNVHAGDHFEVDIEGAGSMSVKFGD